MALATGTIEPDCSPDDAKLRPSSLAARRHPVTACEDDRIGLIPADGTGRYAPPLRENFLLGEALGHPRLRLAQPLRQRLELLERHRTQRLCLTTCLCELRLCLFSRLHLSGKEINEFLHARLHARPACGGGRRVLRSCRRTWRWCAAPAPTTAQRHLI